MGIVGIAYVNGGEDGFDSRVGGWVHFSLAFLRFLVESVMGNESSDILRNCGGLRRIVQRRIE